MKGRYVLAGLASLLATAPAFAQGGSISSECPNGAAGTQAQYTQDACQKAIDIFSIMTPQLGVSLTGGNPLLGARSNIGGLGHLSLGVRATAIQGFIPDFENLAIQTNGAGASEEVRTKDQILGAPGAEVAVGIFKGIPLGPIRFGQLEGIVSANYIPEYSDDNFELKAPDGSLKLGFGGRLGLIGEGAVNPGISVSYLRRDLPTLNFTAVTGSNDASIELDQFKVKTTALRGVLTKNVGPLGLAVGAGQDQYDAAADLKVDVAVSASPAAITACGADLRCTDEISFAQKVTRTTMFANATLNLILFRIGAEVGQVTGGDVKTFNTFADHEANESQLYGSVAIRFGW